MTPTVTAAAAATALAEATFLSPAQGTRKEIPFQPLMHVGAPGTFPSDGAGCCRGHCGGCCPHVANTSPPSGAEADCACGFDAVQLLRWRRWRLSRRRRLALGRLTRGFHRKAPTSPLLGLVGCLPRCFRGYL
jgi:hypothetical protein